MDPATVDSSDDDAETQTPAAPGTGTPAPAEPTIEPSQSSGLDHTMDIDGDEKDGNLGEEPDTRTNCQCDMCGQVYDRPERADECRCARFCTVPWCPPEHVDAKKRIVTLSC